MVRDPATDPESDEALVSLHLQDPQGAGGRAALERLVGRWSPRTYRWAFRLVREREQALDVAQDCLVQMIQALPRYQMRGRFSAWLFTIVHNRCLDHIRRQRRAAEPGADLDAFPDRGPGPEEWVEREHDRERVFAAMRERLEPHERMALWMRAYEELSVEDITRLLRLEGASGARGLLQTARRKLRAALGDEAAGSEGPR